MAFAKSGGKAAASKAAPRSGQTAGRSEPTSETRFGHPGSGKGSNDKNKAR